MIGHALEKETLVRNWHPSKQLVPKMLKLSGNEILWIVEDVKHKSPTRVSVLPWNLIVFRCLFMNVREPIVVVPRGAVISRLELSPKNSEIVVFWSVRSI